MPLEEFERLVEASEEDVETASLFGRGLHARITSALRTLGKERDMVAIQCFPYIMRAGYTPCLSIALLNASGRLVACEGIWPPWPC